MGNMYMADPIRPEDLNSSSILGGGSNKWNSHNNQNNQKNNNSTNKVIAAIIIVFFALPFAAFIFVVLFVGYAYENEAFDDISGGISNVPIGYYELSDDQQMAAARIFSTGLLYDKGGPKTIAQSDCRHLKNAVTAYFNFNDKSAQWYDNTYCKAANINLATYFLDEDEEELGGVYARIDIGPEDDTLGCMNIAFAQNFRFIAVAKKLGHCNASKISIKADNIAVPEIEPSKKSEDDSLKEDSDESYRNVQHS